MGAAITFHSAYASGTLISQLGSGTYDTIGFFGSAGTAHAVVINEWQGSTCIVDSAGASDPAIGNEAQLLNVKYLGSTTCQVSGWNADISNINVFDVENLNTYPDFLHRPSGTLLIMFTASGSSEVHTYNVKLYAYDATGSPTDPPPDVSIMGFEINASGQWYSGQSGVWVAMAGSNYPLYFVNHSSTNGWEAKNQHIWVAAISARPNSVGVLNDFNFAFSCQFA